MSCLIDPDGLPEVERMCRTHPGTPVIIDHLARIGADGVIRDADVAAICQTGTLSQSPRQNRRLLRARQQAAAVRRSRTDDWRVIEAFGARRCMWESDSPFQVQPPHRYQASIDLVRGLDFLTDAERAVDPGRDGVAILFRRLIRVFAACAWRSRCAARTLSRKRKCASTWQTVHAFTKNKFFAACLLCAAQFSGAHFLPRGWHRYNEASEQYVRHSPSGAKGFPIRTLLPISCIPGSKVEPRGGFRAQKECELDYHL